MKKKDFESLKKNANIKELMKMVSDKKKEIVVVYAKIKAGQEKNVSLIRKLKNDTTASFVIRRNFYMIRYSDFI